ncbi:XdhC/CoxI family protein [Streptomyces sp. TRM 70361]|uniref:XdhC family protein n=1 Tax=Streptomyces sp. TRM 70361 TaxID=3116553 RepID=UPI002E7B05D2|nr:XdhC/CoxI family protein [Streptomyces sp. TRM 70361]MEE1938407.1 XdhC/CoxI family protein [Streptomyces sp. TRM 70361]
MLNIADELHAWCRAARPFALATVVQVSGSAPLPVGTSLAVDGEGNAVGSVSGGCVEGAVYELCRHTLEADGPPAVRERFGYSDEDAFAMGLTCGGELEILVQRINPTTEPHLTTALAAVAADRPAAVARVVDGPPELLGRTLSVLGDDDTHHGTLGGDERQDRAAAARTRALLRAGSTARTDITNTTEPTAPCPDNLTLLVHTHAPPPRLLIFGAVDFTAALSRAGRFLGYRVTVCDARPVFATPARFPAADEVVTDWPHRYLAATEVDARTAICVLTHDAKFDVPLLRLALGLPVGYVGAMGSRRTHARRLELLREAGVPDDQLILLHSPIGLDLGAHTPEETAISITAEIIAHTHHAPARPLTHTSGPIHRPAPAAHPTPEEPRPIRQPT